MGERIHAGEADTGEDVVRALLRAECPQWADRPLQYLRASGTDNAMWRAGDVVVRLPRHDPAAGRFGAELDIIDVLGMTATPFRVPTVRHVGAAHDGVYPHRWAVLDWIDGVDAWTARDTDIDPVELAEIVRFIGAMDVPAPTRLDGERGGPLEPLVRGLERMLADPRWDAAAFVDVDAVLGVAHDGLATAAATPTNTTFLHGDLLPGNLLLDPATNRVTAVIDWGMAGWGDPAQDLAPAWAVLGDADARDTFRSHLGVDDGTWRRARAIEAIHAVAAIVYYGPMGHQLGDVMTRTLGRILADR